MILEIHDVEGGNTLCGRVNDLDYDYQAEQWVQDIVAMEKKRESKPQHRLDRIVLKDDAGARAEWKVHENLDVELVSKAHRFAGEWEMNRRFTP